MNIIWLAICLLFPGLAVAGLEEPPIETVWQGDLDFSAIIDPFESKFPKQEIVQRAVEPPVQTSHNGFIPEKNLSNAPAVKPKGPALPAFKVQGIIWGSSYPQAIVNDRVVSEGDLVQKARIEKIQKEGIEVMLEGKRFHVSIDE